MAVGQANVSAHYPARRFGPVFDHFAGILKNGRNDQHIPVHFNAVVLLERISDRQTHRQDRT